MLFAESETGELKSVYVEHIKKESIAFANTRGGTIYIGVEDNGSVCGVENADAVMQQLLVERQAQHYVQPVQFLQEQPKEPS